MRILAVSSTYAPDINGQSIFTTNLMESLASQGHEIMVLVPGNDISRLPGQVGSIQIITTPSLSLDFIYDGFAISWRYKKIIRKTLKDFKPDVIHLQDSAPVCRFVAKAARRLNIPVMATHHPGPAVWAPYFTIPFKKLEGLLSWIVWQWIITFLNRLSLVTVPSRAAAKILASEGIQTRVLPISCGVRLDQFNPVPGFNPSTVRKSYGLDPQKTLFLFVGRLDREKEVELLVRAFRSIKRGDVQLAVVGTGPLEEELQELTRNSGISEKVHFLGSIPHHELNPFINAADIFVMPSSVESFSISTIEAMACGKPILAANAMALPELVANHINGILFEAHNEVHLIECIHWMADNPDQWRRMGEESLVRARNHRISQVIEQYERIFRVLTHKDRVSAPTIPLPVRSPFHSMMQILEGYLPSVLWVPFLLVLIITFLLINGQEPPADTIELNELGPMIVQEIKEIIQEFSS